MLDRTFKDERERERAMIVHCVAVALCEAFEAVPPKVRREGDGVVLEIDFTEVADLFVRIMDGDDA